MAKIFREEGATNVRFVWSPAGNDNALDYFPGGDVVDYVGLTALADADWDAAFGLPAQSFDDIVGPRYLRLEPLGKPIIVAELGVSGGRAARPNGSPPPGSHSMPTHIASADLLRRQEPAGQPAVRPDWRLEPDRAGAF